MLARALPRTAAAIDARMGTLHVGAQLYVSRRGEVVADAALGLARPGVPMTPASLMPWTHDTGGESPRQPSPRAPRSERDLGCVIPGGNGRGPMRELGRVLEMPLGGGARGAVQSCAR